MRNHGETVRFQKFLSIEKNSIVSCGT